MELNSALLHLFCACGSSQVDEAAPTEHGWYNFFSHDPVTTSSLQKLNTVIAPA